ncbi:bifunctional diaminohydroxyphosphoribosylaminopyrimidine deaminase/5-amino-6-(5-phosphoribosylamino)uracil reductase RibD [Vibrio salinus]|uniref:bifunctional diaminohydroxyphosphoribosylaminopyrimidine deaminase/5-amino-6-(5-phosphoribosylamino)uracil reductase RibD n=1 Tax=Vibrio salinus TaxID=2899784 RepID=UPI001E2E845F|nr:bifunctional diaminohydroxyphosphoribosylaminopyrimidine deaminase/5-amino-6-(5-phosphoribosylamino)uracil reductase RibD [Vibrio salinus]MCE0494372.1 bifunctional diaminohydroxyphosphoribosylaminopyrimidine deaminase/5-amino-6-(5-phosphoribosylamino)uracil reductase RibD [Vibrio salinus]
MTMFSSFDHLMMARAISLAKKGVFTTHPNPNVGCVITSGNKIVGEGCHFKAGEPHAEVYALRMAGDKARGATAYVTLEPCSHYGRTPPCAKGLIDAGISQVVCAMQDPNPQVSGRGIQMLRDAGIDVRVGLLEADARHINRAFLKKMESGRPWVQLKMAASIDGQTALDNGESQWITSAEARQDVQKFRAQAGAILSTSQTVISDNASLNVRWSDLPSSVKESYPDHSVRQPVRVILDRQHRLKPDMALFQSGGAALTAAESEADVVVPLDSTGRLDLSKLMDALANDLHINHIWVEAGATLASSMILSGMVDELVIYLAPKMMGSDGKGLFGTFGFTSMKDVIDLEFTDIRMVGKDLRVIAKPLYKLG